MPRFTAPPVFIHVPAFRKTNCSETTASLMALAKALLLGAKRDYYFNEWSWPDIAEARNVVLTIWYDTTDAEFFLGIDDDMSFEPQLVLDMLRLNQPLAGCFYPKRTLPIQFVGQLLPGEPLWRDGFLKVKDFGAGVILIRRDCVARMLETGMARSDPRVATHGCRSMLEPLGVKRIIRAFDKIETPTGALSEDKSFCKRHRDAGGEVWASVDHEITHIGPYGFKGRFNDRLTAAPA